MKLKIEGIEIVISTHSLKVLKCADWKRFHSDIKGRYFGEKIKQGETEYVLKI